MTTPLNGSNVGSVVTSTVGPANGEDVNAGSVNPAFQTLIDNDVTLDALKLDVAGGTISGDLTVTGNMQIDGDMQFGSDNADTVSIPGNIRVTTSQDVALTYTTSAGETRTRTRPITWFFDTTNWTAGTDAGGALVYTSGSIPAGATGHKAYGRIDGIPKSVKITAIVVYFKGGAGHSNPGPGDMPSAKPFTKNSATWATSAGSAVQDSWVDVATYEAPHGITMTVSYTNWDSDGYSMWVEFESESGTGTFTGLTLSGECRITYEQKYLDS